MLRNRRYLITAVLAVLSVSLMAGSFQAPAVRAADVKRLTTVGTKGDIPSVDPALAEDSPSFQIIRETHYALIRGLENDLGKIQPGLAEKWVVSSDGLTYTFTIRKNIPWVMWDGKQVAQVKDSSGKVMNVTAKDFEYGIKRTLDPRTASPYAYVFTPIIKGADEFNSSKETGDGLTKLRDAVGAVAKDDQTLVITLTQPAAFALGILTLPGVAAQPQASIEKFGDKWTEPGNSYSYGPYVISQWKHDEIMVLSKNPFWPGIENSPKPAIDEIALMMIDSSTGFANYEAGSTDEADVPSTEIDRVKSDPKLSKEVYTGPDFGTEYYGFNVTKAPFDNVHMRRAFSYAVDRKALVESVTKGGQIPARWFISPGLAAAPTLENSPKLGISFDLQAAKKELQAYLDEKKITVDQIPVVTLMVNQTEENVKKAEAIQQMWQDALGVKVNIDTQEWKVFLKTLSTDSPQVWRGSWTVDYPDASNFSKDVWYTGASINGRTKWSNKDYDKLVDDAAKLSDSDKRLVLYRQADDILVVKDAVIIPLYWYSRLTLTKPYVKRTYSVMSGDDRYEKWDIKK